MPTESEAGWSGAQAFRRLLVTVGLWTAAVAAGGMVLGGVIDGGAGVAGGAVAAGVVALFSGSTVAVMAATMNRPVAVQSAWLVGTWIIKTLMLLAVLVVVDASSGVNRTVLGVGILVGVIGCLVLDTRLVLKARISPGE